MDELSTDVLIVGSGGAGMFAALRCADAGGLSVTVAVKGVFGKSGCTRMVQGGFNAAVGPDDSVERHFRDTIVGGEFINDQAMALALTTDAPRRVAELEDSIGCRFDRDGTGALRLKPFAGQTADRTVHRGDLTGIEIVSRLADQVMMRPDVRILDEVRAVDVICSDDGARVAGALLIDLRTGRPLLARARCVLIATGGGARMYRYSSPSVEKSGDGIAMAYRAGLELIDMEMLQFHPTGLMAGDGILTGSVVEEGLRGVGGYLRNAAGERFMARHDPDAMERSTRDRVSRAIKEEIDAGRHSPQGGVFLDMTHLEPGRVAAQFPGMMERARLAGRDLAAEPIEVVPTGHFHMGGVRIDTNGATAIDGLYVAGEDAGGVHGANRLGGNGVAESTVFGVRAGEAMAAGAPNRHFEPISPARLAEMTSAAMGSKGDAGDESPFALRRELESVMWEGAGVLRDRAGLEAALASLDDLGERSRRVQFGRPGAYDLAWHEAVNLRNLLVVARALCHSALTRTESRGAHHRTDHPQRDDRRWLTNVIVRRDGDAVAMLTRPVELTHHAPADG